MSHSTLDDFYKGMRQPRYNGNNVLNQLKQLQGGATMQQSTVVQQTTHTHTATATRPMSGSGDQTAVVPPLGAISVPGHTSSNSYDRHVAVSYTDQGLSKMFNEQSFGK